MESEEIWSSLLVWNSFYSIELDLFLIACLIFWACAKRTTHGNGVTMPLICLLVWFFLASSRQPKGIVYHEMIDLFA